MLYNRFMINNNLYHEKIHLSIITGFIGKFDI